jgi:hypothetical protein
MRVSALFVLFFLQVLFCFSQDEKKNRTSAAKADSVVARDTVLMVVGTFSLRNNLIHNIHVYLYLEQKRIDSAIVSGNQEFGFYLRRNTVYYIEVLKDGYLRKNIGISTDLPDDVKPATYFTFGCTLPLIKKQEGDEDIYVQYVSELPIAYIFYNDKIKKFDTSKDYTAEQKERFSRARQSVKELNKKNN